MAYSATIPKHIIFNGSFKGKKTPTRADWDRLPTTDPHQGDARRFSEKLFNWVYWGTSSKKEVEQRAKEKLKYVHLNKPTKLAVVGWSAEYMQACLPTGHVVELTPDILFNAIRSKGFEKDKRTLKGEFIFVQANRKLIPIQVGSGIYKSILRRAGKKAQASIKVKDLVVGNVYKTAVGNSALFLGYVNTETIVVDLPIGVKSHLSWNHQQLTKKTPVQDFKVRFLKKKLASLWFEFHIVTWNGNKQTSETLMKQVNDYIHSPHASYAFQCKKSHSYITREPKFQVDLPTDIVNSVRRSCENQTRKKINHYRLRRGCGANYNIPIAKLKGEPDHLRHLDAIMVTHQSALCNMTLYGLDVIRSDVFKQFEPWETKSKPRKNKKS